MRKPQALGETMRAAVQRLAQAGIAEADTDARLIVEHATGTTRLDLIARPDRTLAGVELDGIDAALARRVAGEPVHRILGAREFYGLTLRLSPATLEPRADTEVLVDAALDFARKRHASSGPLRILDLGTGTGAILIALLVHLEGAQGLAIDISDEALETAAANADLNSVGDRYGTLRSDWFDAVDGRFDLIVSNPPYIRRADIAGLSVEVYNHDPHVALDGGDDGLACYRRIAAQAGTHLENDGQVIVEIGFDQADEVNSIFEVEGFVRRDLRVDLGGNDRVLVFAKA